MRASRRIGTTRALRRSGVPDAGVLAAVTGAWPAAVGQAIARRVAAADRARRDAPRDHCLVDLGVRARSDGGGGAQEARARARRPDAARCVSPRPAVPEADPESARPPVVPTAAEEAEAASLSSAIDDPELRDAVRRAAAASLARGRDDRDV